MAPQARYQSRSCFGLAGGVVLALLGILSMAGACPAQSEFGPEETGAAAVANPPMLQVLHGDSAPHPAEGLLDLNGYGEGDWVDIDHYAEFQLLPPIEAMPATRNPRRSIRPGIIDRYSVAPPDHLIGAKPPLMPAIIKKIRFGYVKPDPPAAATPRVAGLEERPSSPSTVTLDQMLDGIRHQSGVWDQVLPDDTFSSSHSATDPAPLADELGSNEFRAAAIAPVPKPEVTPDGAGNDDQPGVKEIRSPSRDSERIHGAVSGLLDDPNQTREPGGIATAAPEIAAATTSEALPKSVAREESLLATTPTSENREPAQPLFTIPDTYVASGIPLTRPESVTRIEKHAGVPLMTYIQRPDVLSVSSRSPAIGRVNRTVRSHATQQDVWESGEPQLLAVFKRDNSFSALILMPDGSTQDVRRGSSFNGGRVTSITTHETVYKKDGKKHTLRIQ